MHTPTMELLLEDSYKPALRLFEIPIIEKSHIDVGTQFNPLVLPA